MKDIVDGSIVVSLDEVKGAMRLMAEKARVIAFCKFVTVGLLRASSSRILSARSSRANALSVSPFLNCSQPAFRREYANSD